MKKMNGGGGDELELNLCLGSPEPSPKANSGGGRNSQEQLRQMTIFYAGHVCVSEVTQFQAKAIICMAKGLPLREEGEEVHQKEKEKEIIISSPSQSSLLYPQQQQQLQQQQQKNNSNNNQYHALPQLVQVQSMKRSLQRFLQKRKTRLDSSSPYCFLRHSLPAVRSL
ncbi:Tify domain-containing protein [Dioscorea alata]|uniref:Tify domain-containing protein n=1 Tax=Dioscorea alata TaxID=55571 RepID=A0ACB7W459_DIOAL|nr:Tify domain-containing protein [Dioscorea alata]